MDDKEKGSLKKVLIYTDGSCLGNPGPGGWAALFLYKEHRKELWGSQKETTNNRMEILAAVEALAALKEAASVEIFTDSQYVKNGITQWVMNWQKNNWRTAGKKEVKNQDLWQRLLKEAARHQVVWHWVKGHGEDIHNQRVDLLARTAAEKEAKELS